MQHHGTAVPTGGLPGLSCSGSASAGLSDEVLAKSCRAGNREAFAEIYRRYVGPVRAYIGRRVPDRAAHEDLVQEVFAEALARLDGFRDDQPNAFRIWLYGAVARPVLAARGLARWREAQAIKGTIDELTRTGRRACAASGSDDLRPLPRELADAVAALPDRQRTVVELRYLEGLPVAQVADLMGMTVNQVTAYASKAVRKLGRPVGVTLVAPARDGTARVYATANGWGGYAYVTSADGSERRKYFHCTSREAAVARWAELSGADLEEVA